MRIVLAGSDFFTDYGGIAPYNRELCSALLERGHDLLVVTTEPSEEGSWTSNDRQKVPVHSTVIPESVSDEPAVAQAMFDRIVEFDPDVLISSDHIYATSLFPCFADRRSRISISHYYDGLLPRVAAARPPETDWIVAITEAGKEFMLRCPDSCPEQIPVIYNSVDELPKVDVSSLIQKKAQSDVLKIVFPGGDARHKSPGTIVGVVNRLAKTDLNWELIWMGGLTSPERLSRRLSDRARKRVTFTDLIPRPQAEQNILEASCFLLPSRGEGCPMSLVEAMRGGTIPLVSDCPSAMRELVEDGVSGYVVDRRDTRLLASHLVELGRSRPLRESMMREARSVYSSRLTKDIWITRMMELMENRRESRPRLKDHDEFDASKLFRWHRRRGRWNRPTPTYLRARFGYPDFSPIAGT
jgi:glycosyltransferase involved in cell wall biosynthesis